MCVNFIPVNTVELQRFGLGALAAPWPQECWQDYNAPIVLSGGLRLASYGFVPKHRLPDGKKYTTMNARAESIGEKPTFKSAWHQGKLCLVPMQAFFEPCYETGRAVRMRIEMADGEPFAVAGLWREWRINDVLSEFSFTQITINADEHPLMRRMHRPGEEKRSLVIVPPEQYNAWLNCDSPELARTFLNPFPAELMRATPDPVRR
ncbi:SOS response-associated peptidase [Chromobacterium subtsugae]|uniref:SOS response-associated peptidase n=1 Tax=Chromobacterium subtsugae TaxID=251747 RepID=UPI0006418019|nr:SOS response-associated peptidase family protein [Chromobacterium subtsugae]